MSFQGGFKNAIHLLLVKQIKSRVTKDKHEDRDMGYRVVTQKGGFPRKNTTDFLDNKGTILNSLEKMRGHTGESKELSPKGPRGKVSF